jgi:hypothetical protein
MTARRRRTLAWIGAAVVVLAALAFLVRRRRARPAAAALPTPPTAVPAPPVEQVTTAPVEGIPASEAAVDDRWKRFEEASAVPSEDGDVAVVDEDKPLATWIRVAIVVVALVAFFAVSLIATKQV